MNDRDPASPSFWSTRYEAGTMPWDLRGIPPALTSFLKRTPGGGRVLIPGCGSGYEVRAFHDAGFDVTAVDFSRVAVERAQTLLGPLASKVQLGDFFTTDLGAANFDLVYERTFLCALPPHRWRDYATRMAELLGSGSRLVGVFVFGHADDGPPFPLRNGQEHELFAAHFRLGRREALAPPALPVFDEMEERWQEWIRL
jgi:SAM-dependent methyltransferase